MTDRARPKNVLVIMTDQQRFDTLGCYGAPICRTPHIDGLAERGVRFDTAYTPTSPCSPARAALFTGLYPHKNGVLANGGVVNPDVPNLASELSAAGYNLGYAGKWHVDNPKNPTDYGFQGKDFPGYGYPVGGGLIEGLRFGSVRPAPEHYEEYLRSRGLPIPKALEVFYGDPPATRTQEIYALQSDDIESNLETMAAEFTIDLMRGFAEDAKNGKPFFLWTNFWGPHTPCFVPEPYYSMYDPADVPYDPSYAENWVNKPAAHDLYERYWRLRQCDWAGWQQIIARYWGYCTMIDDLVGRMLSELERLGLAEDTVVMYTTDHGDQMGAHRMIEKGPFAYEESWRIPLIVADPDCEAPGTVSDEFAYNFDLFPTIVEIAGRTPPDVPDSQSLLDLSLGRDVPTGRDSIYGSYHDHIIPAPLRFVRTRTHKLVYNRCDYGELYDLVNDPHELRNLIDHPAAQAVKAELMERMRAYMVELEDPMLRPFTAIRDVY